MPPKKSLQLLVTVAAEQMARRATGPRWNLFSRAPWFAWRIARREHAHTKYMCKLLLEIHDGLRHEHSVLRSDELYARVVEHALGCDSATSRGIVLDADRSFAQWPAERDVNFRDVVGFLLLNQLMPAHGMNPVVPANITTIVAATIPSGL